MSALFLYSKNPFNHQPTPSRNRIVNQVDLAPTLSLLLNHPIPYGSLGMIIPELFEDTNLAVLNTCVRFNTERLGSDHDLCLTILYGDPLTSSYLMNSIQVMRNLFHYFEGRIFQSNHSDLVTILKHLDLPHPCFLPPESPSALIERREILYLHSLLKKAITFHSEMLPMCSSSSNEDYLTFRTQLHEAYQHFLQESLNFSRFHPLPSLSPSSNPDLNGVISRSFKCHAT